MHEKKIKDKMQNREMALKQKIDVANNVTKVAEEKKGDEEYVEMENL